MITFMDLEPYWRILVLVSMFISLLLNIHIISYAIFRDKNKKNIPISSINMAIYFMTLVSLTTYIYEIELKQMPSKIPVYFATRPLLIYIVFMVVGFAFGIHTIRIELLHHRQSITKSSIKESVDNLPAGLCMSLDNGIIVLSNWQMEKLSFTITGSSLRNGKIFWDAINEGKLKEGVIRLLDTINPIIRLPDGSTWSFNHSIVDLNGMQVIEIIASDITKLNILRNQLEKKNKALVEMGQRLRQYSANVSEIKYREERLATKIRIHDKLGYALLATRRYIKSSELNMEVEESKEILNLWRQNIFLLDSFTQSENSDALNSLYSAADAIDRYNRRRRTIQS